MTDLEKAIENVPKVYEAGRESLYDDFWDRYQENGARTNYSMGFANFNNSTRGFWGGYTFKPKYNIIATGHNSQMFHSFANGEEAPVNLKAILEEQGVTMDLSGTTFGTEMFRLANISHLPVLDLRGHAQLSSTFMNMKNLISIEKLIIHNPPPANCTYGNMFTNDTSLTDIVVEGKFGKDISFQYSPLNKPSITSVVEHLSPDVTGYTATFKQTAVDTAFETAEGLADGGTSEEWLTLVNTKPNWTISLI